MSEYSAIIIDDRKDAIELLKLCIKKYCHNIKDIFCATNTRDGLQKIQEHEPNILFLDIIIGEDTAFNLLDNLGQVDSEVVFISSCNEYALKAFDYNISNYLLKPIDIKKLVQAVNKVCERLKAKIQIKQLAQNHSALIEKNIIAISSSMKIEIIKVDNIIFCEAERSYTMIYLTDGTTKVSSKNLLEYENQLVSKGLFFRIHHKYLVNLNMVENINKTDGNYCEMINKKSLPISKRKREKLFKFLGLS